jgi:hypothetical protein
MILLNRIPAGFNTFTGSIYPIFSALWNLFIQIKAAKPYGVRTVISRRGLDE